MADIEKVLKSLPVVEPDEIDLKILAEIEAETDRSTIDLDDFMRETFRD